MLKAGKTSRYVKYAIGEIILVVIGILIALQINTWNTEYANKKVVRRNSKALIENLEKDIAYSIDKIETIKSLENELLRLEERLSKSSATIDTLIKIARFEFDFLVPTIEFPNDIAYNTMVLSGEINFFDSELKQAIYDLYREHEFLGKISQENFEYYVQATSNYNNSYTLNNPNNIIKGHLQDELWQNINAKDLIAKFNRLASAKRLHFGRRKGDLELITKQTRLLLEKLREIENQKDSRLVGYKNNDIPAFAGNKQ